MDRKLRADLEMLAANVKDLALLIRPEVDTGIRWNLFTNPLDDNITVCTAIEVLGCSGRTVMTRGEGTTSACVVWSLARLRGPRGIAGYIQTFSF